MKYPIGIQSFETLRSGGYVYVDKTDLMWQLAERHICFLCRPRRFGKSLLVSTLRCFFEGRRDLFAGLKVMELEQAWTRHPVFMMAFSSGDYTLPTTLEQKIDGFLSAWEQQYGANPFSRLPSDRFAYVLHQAHVQTGQRAVVLIDEYDKPILDALGRPTNMARPDVTVEEHNRATLRSFYSTFKDADDDLRFVLLTGVTKFSQVSVFSGFNQPQDVSMMAKFDTICGITEEELDAYLGEGLAQMAQDLGVSTAEMRSLVKRRYDGYHFSAALRDVYNPFSLLNAIDSGMLRDYWFASGTPSYLIRMLADHPIRLEEELRQEFEDAYFADYKGEAERPLPMLYQSGYLTIKSYNPQYGTYRLDFPNEEVRKGFVTMLCGGYFRKDDADSWIMQLSDMLAMGRVDDVMQSITAFLADIDYEADRNRPTYESHFQYTIFLIMRLLSCYTTLIEKHNSHGRADMVVETPRWVYIFEFKVDAPADEALAQIEASGYAEPYAADARQVARLGVRISSETRTVAEWKAK